MAEIRFCGPVLPPYYIAGVAVQIYGSFWLGKTALLGFWAGMTCMPPLQSAKSTLPQLRDGSKTAALTCHRPTAAANALRDCDGDGQVQGDKPLECRS